jgi:hypothetical protein
MVIARRDGVGDGSGKAMAMVQRGWRRRGVEAEGGVDDGDCDGVASREVTEAPREAATQTVGNLGSLTVQQKKSL